MLCFTSSERVKTGRTAAVSLFLAAAAAWTTCMHAARSQLSVKSLASTTAPLPPLRFPTVCSRASQSPQTGGGGLHYKRGLAGRRLRSCNSWHSNAAAVGNEGSDLLQKDYDLIIIGGGPTGCAAAEKAAYAGHSAMVIDDPGTGKKVQLGGPTGLFSKALRDTASRIDVKLLKAMGLSDKSIWSQVQEMCKEIQLVETQNTVRRLRSIAVPRIQGKASFTPKGMVKLEFRNGKSVEVHGNRYLLATGSSAFQARGIPFDSRRVFDSDSVKDLSYLPNDVAITGAGIIAIEYAKIFAKFGAHVTLIIRDSSFPAAMERVGVDRDIAEALRKDLLASGVEILYNRVVGDFSVPPSITTPMAIQLLDRTTNKPTGEQLRVDTYLFAAGRLPNTNGLGLEEAGVQLDDKGRVLVDGNLETSKKGVYAAGDILGPPGLASTGIEQGAAAVTHMFSTPKEGEAGGGMGKTSFDPKSYLSDPNRFPVGIWTSPEVAYIGLTKKKAEESGYSAVEGVAKYSETTRGRVSRSSGMLKLVVDEGERDLPVIGVSIFGEDACELVHYGMELVQSRRPLRCVLEASHAAVTYHELYKVAAVNIDENIDFSIQLRSTFPLDVLRLAKEKFIQATGKSGTVSSHHDLTGVRITFEDAEEIARELSLMRPAEDFETGGPSLSYAEFFEFLRQLKGGNTARGITEEMMFKAM